MIRYLPIDGAWVLGPAPAGTPSMGYYGVLLLAFAGGALGHILGRIPTVRRRLERPRALAWTAWLTTALSLGAFLWITFHELAHWGAR